MLCTDKRKKHWWEMIEHCFHEKDVVVDITREGCMEGEKTEIIKMDVCCRCGKKESITYIY